MTAVAPPPSLNRLGWESDHQGGFSSMNGDGASRMFVPRKVPQRSNSSSSLSSTASTSSTASDSTVNTTSSSRKDSNISVEKEGWPPQKKGKALWSSVRAEGAAFGAASGFQPQPFRTPPSAASSAQPSSFQPPHNTMQNQHQGSNGRTASQTGSAEPTALLVLIPMNGTFERKQISVPLFPEILRIGRQTNAKTVPTSANGYFDSKVLSRSHAEVWADRSGKIWIRDVKSSNGTFVNGIRLSPESRDSEPHELRENDMLELGIDIVSEDQKSIVHHKVSAKIEHAGLPNSTSSALDLNFGDIDPGSGGNLIGGPFPQHMLRGRGGSQGSVAGNGRATTAQNMANGNINGMGIQRHMNAWLNPVTIEQVVKKLTAELRQAKQQSQDLHRTSDFFNSMLSAAESGQELPRPPADLLLTKPQPNGNMSSGRIDQMSPFLQPPAPPPQQPLPEKPDSARSTHSDPVRANPFRRASLERTGDPVNQPFSKPDSPTSSQILNLIQALESAKRDLDSQGSRVRHLEEQLEQERKARERAEERTKYLLDRSRGWGKDHAGPMGQHPFTPPSDKRAANGQPNEAETTIRDKDPDNIGLAPADPSETAATVDAVHSDHQTFNADSPTKLQKRVEIMFAEMNKLRKHLAQYKKRAETAEIERNGLTEIIQRIRQGEVDAKTADPMPSKRRSSEMSTQTETGAPLDGSADGRYRQAGTNTKHPDETDGRSTDTAGADRYPGGDLAPALVKAPQPSEALAASLPYASMLGVVLIGWGIMLWLNDPPKLER